jgi:hypothetical protein
VRRLLRTFNRRRLHGGKEEVIEGVGDTGGDSDGSAISVMFDSVYFLGIKVRFGFSF